MTFAIMTEGEKLLETYSFLVTYTNVNGKILPALNGMPATKENLKVIIALIFCFIDIYDSLYIVKQPIYI